MLCNTDHKGGYYASKIIDLCPDHMRQIYAVLQMEHALDKEVKQNADATH